MLTVILVVILFTWGFIRYILHINYMQSYLKHVKTTKILTPYIGNMDFFQENFSELVKRSSEILLQIGSPFKFNLGPLFFVVLNQPEDVKIVLTSSKCLDKPFMYGFYPLPLSLLTETSGAAWKPLRKIMNPMFNLKVLQSFLPIFNEKTKYFVKDLEKHIEGSAFDVMPFANFCTMNTICSTVMGINVDLKSSKGIEFIHSMEAIFDMILLRSMKPWNYFDCVYKWTKSYKEEQKHLANIRYFTNRVFEENTKWCAATENNNPPENVSTQPNVSIIPLLFDGNLSEDMIKQQIEILLMAGFETTASTISYAILMLAMHPEIQEDTFNELRSVYTSPSEETTTEHIQKLNVMDRVLRETMRLFPIAEYTTRTNTTDVPVSTCTIPKGSTIVISINTMHRRRDIWGEGADEFNPDHFLPENVQKRHPFAWIPFSAGPRNCIGYQFAMFQLKVILSAILRHYKLSSDLKMSELVLNHGITLRLTNKHMIKVERRKCQFE